jgi:sulfur carrier protein
MTDSHVRINGRTEPLAAAVPLTALLQEQGIDPARASGIAVAVNERIVRRAEWAERVVNPGDDIEIVTARQGG